MNITELNHILSEGENEHVEFKRAGGQFSIDEISKYCVAISNSGGGYLILGVDNKTKKVVGTSIYKNTTSTIVNDVYVKIRLHIHIEEIIHPDGRVIGITIPPRPTGQLFAFEGQYLIRMGESLTAMDYPTLKQILNESQKDFTSNIVENLSLSDLDQESLNILRRIWSDRLNNQEIKKYSYDKLLQSLELITDKGVTYAALILLGTHGSIAGNLPGSEIIFEWRQNSQQIDYDFRKEWKEPFIKSYDDIWNTINSRNQRHALQEGFIRRDIYSFNEKVVREAVLNAISHRDYSISSQSIFIKASTQSIIIQSPGGLIPPVTVNNIIHKSSWRNRKIAEVLQTLGLVERSGQGMDEIFRSSIKEGKGEPSFDGTDESQVVIAISAQISDKEFIKYLEMVENEHQITFSTEEVIELERVRTQQDYTLSDSIKKKFLGLGLIENIGRTSGSKYILSRRYYASINHLGKHTRNKGLSRERCKQFILQHLENHKRGRTQEFYEVLPEYKKKDISNFLQELRRENKILFTGKDKRRGYWVLVHIIH